MAPTTDGGPGVIVVVALVGGLGAMARFGVDTAIARRNRLATPMGTLVVNVTACLLLGLLTGWTLRVGAGSPLVPVLGVGFLGGYSTFSTASVEAARLFLAERRVAAVRHAAVMLVASLAAAVVGIALTS
jgi:fluoride exporter